MRCGGPDAHWGEPWQPPEAEKDCIGEDDVDKVQELFVCLQFAVLRSVIRHTLKHDGEVAFAFDQVVLYLVQSMKPHHELEETHVVETTVAAFAITEQHEVPIRRQEAVFLYYTIHLVEAVYIVVYVYVGVVQCLR